MLGGNKVMSTESPWKTMSAALLCATLLTTPLAAADGSIFLNPVGPVNRIDGVAPGTDPYDDAAIDYVNFRSTVIDPFFNSFFDPTTEVYFPLPGIPNVTVPDESEVRMYFISEEAGFSNQLGFVTGGNFDLSHPDNANSLIFPAIDTLANPAGPLVDTLRENDYVVLADETDGEEVMDFFLIADGADADPNDGLVERVWWTNISLNDDLLQHVYLQPFLSVNGCGCDNGDNGNHDDNDDNDDDNDDDGDGDDDDDDEVAYSYYLVAIEDLDRLRNINDTGGSTNPGDYPIDNTDYIGVLQVISECDDDDNGCPCTHTPEPQTYMLLGGFLAVAAYSRRRRQQQI